MGAWYLKGDLGGFSQQKAKCSPAGSPVLRPELLGLSLRPGLASLLALGVRPKRPAARKMVVDATMICGIQHFRTQNAFNMHAYCLAKIMPDNGTPCFGNAAQQSCVSFTRPKATKLTRLLVDPRKPSARTVRFERLESLGMTACMHMKSVVKLDT